MYWGLHGASSYVQHPPSERAQLLLSAGQPQQNLEIWRILTAGEPYAQQMHFRLPPSAPLTDYLSITGGPFGFLASPKLLRILDDVCANTARYPATLISAGDSHVLSEDYTYCVLPTIAAADRHRSSYIRDEMTGACDFIELVVAPSIENLAIPLFVLAGYPRMLIHERLRQRLQEEAIRGWQAFPLDVISDMIIFGPLKVEIERRLQQHSTNGRLWACLAYLLHGLGHIERAVAAYERAISLIDYSAYIWGGSGELYAEVGRWTEAKRAYERALSLTATPPSWFYGDYSAVLLALDEDDAAMQAARQGMQAAQHGRQIMIATGMPWYRLGRVAQKKVTLRWRYDSFKRRLRMITWKWRS
jgi:hypothetical protein